MMLPLPETVWSKVLDNRRDANLLADIYTLLEMPSSDQNLMQNMGKD
jgi:hypothetical protein